MVRRGGDGPYPYFIQNSSSVSASAPIRVDCESLTPTQGATQQSVDCESLTRTQGATQQSVDSEIVPVSSIAPEGWGPKEGRNATSPLHSWGSPTKGTKSEVKTYARGHNDAPSISKYGSLVQPDTQTAALHYVRALSAPPKMPLVGHGSKKMPGARPARLMPPLRRLGRGGEGRGGGSGPWGKVVPFLRNFIFIVSGGGGGVLVVIPNPCSSIWGVAIKAE